MLTPPSAALPRWQDLLRVALLVVAWLALTAWARLLTLPDEGRYVGVAPGEAVSDEDFKEQLEVLNEELETLNTTARELEQYISTSVASILE